MNAGRPLDARSFADLLKEAEAIVRARSPAWTDLSPGDPGMTLIEVYAHLTEVMLYRLNRIPDRLHEALLKLLGVAPLTPSAAVATLTFSLPPDAESGPVEIPAGTRVSDPAGRTTFATIEGVSLSGKGATGQARALHAEAVEGELLGLGTGGASQSLRLKRPPVVRTPDDAADLRVGVETDPGAIGPDDEVITLNGKAFLLWDEAAGFTDASGRRLFVCDRTDGRITFAPLAGIRFGTGQTMAAIPPAGAEIRAWYRSGGGRAGNVGAGTLTLMRTPLAGVSVTNRDRASGGEDGETPEQMLARGQQAVRSLECAVTAGDFERVALEAGGVARARAYAQREFWAFGEPGTVEILIVPRMEDGPAVNVANLEAHRTPDLIARVNAALDARRPLGVRCLVKWASCRPVSVGGRVVVSPSEDPEAMRTRLTARLDRLLSPVAGWPFGKTLRASDVYETILAEPGVRFAEGLVLSTDDGPTGEIESLIPDPHQARTLHAAAGEGVYRSLDEGGSWSRVLKAPGSRIGHVAANADVPGLVAVASEGADRAWTIHVSRDAGETWLALETVQHVVFDLAWIRRDQRPILLVAARNGLYQIDPNGPRGLVPLRVRPGEADADGFFAVAAGINPAGTQFVAAASRSKAGVFLSNLGGLEGSFVELSAGGRDVRTLLFERDGGQLFLWAGIFVEAGAAADGVAMRIAARADGPDPTGWTRFAKGWTGGSCLALSIAGPLVTAGTRDGGVLVLDTSVPAPSWRAPLLDCGLPIDTGRARLLPVNAVAASAAGTILAGTMGGLFKGAAERLTFTPVGGTRFTDRVPLPPNWLYCSGAHDLAVVSDSDGPER